MIWNGFLVDIFLLLYGLPGAQFLHQIFMIIIDLHLLIPGKAVEHESSHPPTQRLTP